MYYDGNSGNYLVYDDKSQQYSFADVTTMQSILDERKKQSEKVLLPCSEIFGFNAVFVECHSADGKFI